MSRISRLIVLFIIAAIVSFSLILIAPSNIQPIYLQNYTWDSVFLVISIIIFGMGVVKGEYDLLSPVTIVTFIYGFMFFVTPIYDILLGEYYWFGVDLFEYGVKGSIIAFVGYISFIICYDTSLRDGKLTKSNSQIIHIAEVPVYQYEGNGYMLFIIFGYIICFLSNVYYLTTVSGSSILYIFTLGLRGSSGVATSADIGAISMLSYALPSFTLLYSEYGKNRIFKVIAFILMFVLQVARGFRFFILQIVIMFGCYYYLRHNRKPKIREMGIVILITLVPIIIMTLFRSTIRTGGGMDLSIISTKVILDALDAAFWDNFRIYKSYYGIIKAVPNMTNYLHGQQMIVYTLIMLIPRALWKNKPGNPGTEAQRLGINQVAVLSGSAYPNIGEYYYEFGVVGVMVCMGILGKWTSKIQKKYRFAARTNVDLMVYSTILGTTLQMIIRGYTPSNFWMLVFCLLPFWLMNMLSRKKQMI